MTLGRGVCATSRIKGDAPWGWVRYGKLLEIGQGR